MSKILKNNTASIVEVSDTGISIPASGQYTIPPQDYLLWAASDDILLFISNGTVIFNNGSDDLGVSDGIDALKGVIPKSIEIKNLDKAESRENILLLRGIQEELKLLNTLIKAILE